MYCAEREYQGTKPLDCLFKYNMQYYNLVKTET